MVCVVVLVTFSYPTLLQCSRRPFDIIPHVVFSCIAVPLLSLLSYFPRERFNISILTVVYRSSEVLVFIFVKGEDSQFSLSKLLKPIKKLNRDVSRGEAPQTASLRARAREKT